MGKAGVRSAVGAIAAGLLLVASDATGAAQQKRYPPTLDLLANLPMALPDGRSTAIGQQAPVGRATIVSFWATWCAPCAAEARYLSNLRQRYPSTRLAILAVNVDEKPDATKVEAFLARTGAQSLTQLRGTKQTLRAFTGPTVFFGLPRLYVFDAAGRPVVTSNRFTSRTARRLDAAVATATGAGNR